MARLRPVPERFFSASSVWVEQLSLLPEVQQAMAATRTSVAVPLLTRAVDICSSAMPEDHPLPVHAKVILATTHASLGDYASAAALLHNIRCDDADYGQPAAQALAVCLLLSGETPAIERAEQAERAAWRAFELADTLDPATTDMAALGEALHVVGLARMLQGDRDGAVDHLQQATRMLDVLDHGGDPSPSVAALVNLGAAHMWLADDGEMGLADYFAESIASGVEPCPFPFGGWSDGRWISSLVNDVNASEAVAYWQEAVQLIDGDTMIATGFDHSGPPNSHEDGATAAEESSWTGCTSLPPSSSDIDERKRDRLSKAQKARLAVLRACALTSIAESKLVGKGSESSGSDVDIEKSSDLLVEALDGLKMLQQLKFEKSKNAESDKITPMESLSTALSFATSTDNEKRVRGRALAGLARCNHLAGKAVTAEGLYRAALDELNVTAAMMDEIKTDAKTLLTIEKTFGQNQLHGRLGWEVWRALDGYQLLLADWEDRDADAAKVKAASAAIFKSIATSGGALSTGAILIPPDFCARIFK